MNLGTLRAKVKRDHPEANTFTDAQINTELNESQLEIAFFTDCLPTTSNQSLTFGTETFALPTDFLKPDREGGVLAKVNSSNTKFDRLVYRTEEELDQLFPFWRDASASTPHSYFIRDSNIHIYPKQATTTVASGLRSYYFQKPTSMDSDGTQPWNSRSYLEPFHKVICMHTAMTLLTAIKKYSDAQAIETLYADRILAMRTFMTGEMLRDWSPDVRMGYNARQWGGRKAGRFA